MMSKTVTGSLNGKRDSSFNVKALLWPSIIFVAIVTQIPFLITLYYSFQKWNLMRVDKGITFTGLTNFTEILTNAAFYQVLSNTLIFTVVTVLLCLVLGMTLAVMMNRSFLGRGLIRTMLVSPFFIMPSVSGIIWTTMFLNPSFGFFSYLLGKLGMEPIDWLARFPLEIIILIVVWEWTPFFMLILLAGLQSVPEESLEAAAIDGANKTKQYYHIIIPHLLKYIEIALLLGTIFITQIFGEIYVSTVGGPGYSSTNLSFFIFRIGFQSWNIGEAAALALIIVVIMTICLTLLFRVLRGKFGGELS